MKAISKLLYEELRQTEQESLLSLQKEYKHQQVKAMLEEELADTRLALKKIEKGSFGYCEASGEMISEEFLRTIPTLKTKNDFIKLSSFYRKQIHSFS